MAKRPVFIPDPDPNGSLVVEKLVDFTWFGGFSVSQKRKCIESLHRAARRDLGIEHLVEISTKSERPLGRKLSAFNLVVQRRGDGRRMLLEAAFQGSKVFAKHGRFDQLYEMKTGRDIKKFVRPYINDKLVGFRFDGINWELCPKTAFYDFLYARAVKQLVERNSEIDDDLMKIDAFTDIEFNPARSINCQARSCALYVALLKMDRLNVLSDRDELIRLIERHGYGCTGNRTLF